MITKSVRNADHRHCSAVNIILTVVIQYVEVVFFFLEGVDHSNSAKFLVYIIPLRVGTRGRVDEILQNVIIV